MNTRRKVDHLKLLGFKKSDIQLTRVGLTYERGPSRVTIGKGDQGGGHFIALAPGGSFNSSLLEIGNTSEGMKSYLRGLMWDGADVPDPDDPTFGTPTWFDELFVSITSMLP